MLWEGLRIYSRSQYSAVPTDCRFILTEEVRNTLHPDIPEGYVGRSILIIRAGNVEELEVEGINFLVVDTDVPEFLIMSQREAERQYPIEMTAVRNTGASAIVREFQTEQEALVKIASGKKTAVRRASSKKPAVKIPRNSKKKETPKDDEEPEITVKPVSKPVKEEKPAKLPSKKTTRKPAPKEEKKPVIDIPAEEPKQKEPEKPANGKTSPKKSHAVKKTETSGKESGGFKKKAAVRSDGSVLLPLWKHKK